MVDFCESDISCLLEPRPEIQEQTPKPDTLHLETEESDDKKPASELVAAESEGANVLEKVVFALNRKFLRKNGKRGIEEPQRGQAKRYSPLARQNHTNPSPEYRPQNVAELFSYLGHLKTAHNIYRRHMLTEYKEKKQEEKILRVDAKPTDMSYDEVEKIITAEKMNRLMGTKIHHIGAEAKERWEVLKLFPFYRILSILRYQTSMT